MTEQPGQTGQQQTGQQNSGQQQSPPDWYTNPPAWLKSPPAPVQQQHSGGGPDLASEIQAMPERVVRALQDAITAATQQQHSHQNSGQQQQQQNSGQQDNGQQQNSGQQHQNIGQDNSPGGPQSFGDWWFSKT
jgi:hypothetical protein